jgi:hypothetical protein
VYDLKRDSERRMVKLAAALLAAALKPFGPREIALLSGLALVAYGASQVYPPAGAFIPGAVLLYIAIAGLR